MASPETTPLTVRKEELSRTTERYKQAIEDQVTILKHDAGKVTRTALIVGGAAFGTYLVARAIANRKKKKRQANEIMYPYPSAHSHGVATPTKSASPMGNLIKRQIALFLIAIAKKQIVKAIERTGKHDNEHYTKPVTIT